MARGTEPLITLLATWLVASEQINAITAIAIGILVSGIWLVAIGRSKTLKLDKVSLFFALVTSCFIAAYTVVDGLGGRASGSASAYTALVVRSLQLSEGPKLVLHSDYQSTNIPVPDGLIGGQAVLIK